MKKNRKKRISAMISLVLAFTMLLGTGSVFAGNGEESKALTSSSLIYEAEHFLLAYFSEANNARSKDSVYKLGNAIPTYEFIRDSLVNFEKAKYYPIFEGNKVLGIMIVNGADEKYPTYSFGKEFADELNVLINIGYEKYCFVLDEGKLYLKDDKKVDLLVDNSGYDCYDLTIKNQKPQTDKAQIISDLSVSNIKYYSSNNAISALNLNNKTVFNKSISDESLLSYAPGKNLDVVAWDQKKTNLCWAGSVECIGEYVTGNKKYSALSIQNTMGVKDGTAQIEDAQNALSTLYGISTRYTNTLADSTVLETINYNRPAYMNFQATNAGHALTLCGYLTEISTNYFGIRVMNTTGGVFQYFKKTGNTYKYTGVGNKTYTFSDALMID